MKKRLPGRPKKGYRETISKLSLVIFMCDRNDEILLDDDQLVENKNLF